MEWYSLETYPSQDWKIKAAIRTRHGTNPSIGEVFVPMEFYESFAKDGSIKIKIRKSIPGYIFINCDLTPEVEDKITSIPGVVRFLGKPAAIVDVNEVKEMITLLNKVNPIPEPEDKLKVGTKVRITGGSFVNVDGVVSAEPKKNKVKVDISVFGTIVAIEVNEDHLMKLTPEMSKT